MADLSPQAFVDRTFGHMYDLDGFPSSNKYQCWDGIAECCHANGVPLAVIYCGTTGYVQDIWDRRNKSNILNYFEEVEAGKFKNGDWVIFPFSYHMTPLSHVCMYWDGRAYGQNQSGSKAFCFVDYLDFSKALGGFRLKTWIDQSKLLQIGSGSVLFDMYAGQEIQIRGFKDNRKITLISAKTNGKVNGNDVQLLPDIDDHEHIYYSKINANRWIMATGQALGVRIGVNEWSVPRQNAFYFYTLLKDGTTHIGMDSDFWYASDLVEFACSPDVILMFGGVDKMLYSPAVVGTKEGANVQSLLIRTKDRFATALVKGRLTPVQCLAWAKCIDGVRDVIMMDSGGSSCQQIGTQVTYATGEHRKISNAIAEYENKTASAEQETVEILPITEATGSDSSLSEEVSEADEEEHKEEEKPAETAQNGGGNGQMNLTRNAGEKEGKFMLNDKVYTFLKWLCLICLPAVAFFLMQYGQYLGIENPEIISKLINGIATLLGTLIGVSTVNYNNSKAGDVK